MSTDVVVHSKGRTVRMGAMVVIVGWHIRIPASYDHVERTRYVCIIFGLAYISLLTMSMKDTIQDALDDVRILNCPLAVRAAR
jgi:hypothetical protein